MCCTRSTRSRVDHFGRGLQVVAADRCNTSASSRVVQPRRRWRTTTTAGISTSPSLYLRFLFPPSSFLLSPSFSHFVFISRAEYTNWQYRPCRFIPPLSPTLPPFLYHIPPTLSSHPGSSQCTTHVLTERRTSNFRGSRCDPLRVRHPPDGGLPRRSTSHCSLPLGDLAGSVLAWRPSGT